MIKEVSIAYPPEVTHSVKTIVSAENALEQARKDRAKGIFNPSVFNEDSGMCLIIDRQTEKYVKAIVFGEVIELRNAGYGDVAHDVLQNLKNNHKSST